MLVEIHEKSVSLRALRDLLLQRRRIQICMISDLIRGEGRVLHRIEVAWTRTQILVLLGLIKDLFGPLNSIQILISALLLRMPSCVGLRYIETHGSPTWLVLVRWSDMCGADLEVAR